MSDERKQQSNEFVASAMYRNTSRRELMRRAGLLGISAAAIPSVLRSHGVAAQDVATPMPDPICGRYHCGSSWTED